MIIGEALNKALRLNPDIKISDAKKIISLRNKIVHDYDGIDGVNLWYIIHTHLPLLHTEINYYIPPIHRNTN